MTKRNVQVLLQDGLLSYAYLAQPFVGKNEQGETTYTYTLHAPSRETRYASGPLSQDRAFPRLAVLKLQHGFRSTRG